MLFVNKFIVRKHERAMLFKDGDFKRFLDSGVHRFYGLRYTVERFDIAKPRFNHDLVDLFVKDFPQDVAKYFEVVETSPTQAAVTYKNGRLDDVFAPDKRMLFWKGLVEITAELFDVSEDYVVPERIAKPLLAELNGKRVMVAAKAIHYVEVPEGHVGLLSIDGKLVDELASGAHAFWKFNRNVAVTLMDLRIKALEVGGQEILTKDKVGLRINVTANYRYTDAMAAAKAVRDPLDYLYKEIQLGLRAAVGTRVLDALLEEKDVLDKSIFEHVRGKFADIGIEVRSIGVKDIVLPGDMKNILGKVVEATKAAQANVIRRREETNATRSLLNTAKVMEDNPVALRLKELETLEKVTEKIGNLSVYGGLDGVLNEIVHIKR